MRFDENNLPIDDNDIINNIGADYMRPPYPYGYNVSYNKSALVKRTGFFQGNTYDVAYNKERLDALFDVLSIKEAKLLTEVNYASDIEDIVAMRDALNKCIDVIQTVNNREKERNENICKSLDPTHNQYVVHTVPVSGPGSTIIRGVPTTATPVPPVSPVKIGDDLDHEPVVTCGRTQDVYGTGTITTTTSTATPLQPVSFDSTDDTPLQPVSL